MRVVENPEARGWYGGGNLIPRKESLHVELERRSLSREPSGYQFDRFNEREFARIERQIEERKERIEALERESRHRRR